MAQGVIKSVLPQVTEGIHRSWQNKFTGKPNFGFIIEFEDGTTGNCASEKSIYPLAVGTTVTYDIKLNSQGANNITSVKKLELNVVPASARPFNDPATTKRIAFSMCQSIARIHYFTVGISPRSVDDINTLADVYSQWVLANLQENDQHFRDMVSRRYYALQLSVECIPFSDMGINGVEKVIESAEGFLKPIHQIGYASQD